MKETIKSRLWTIIKTLQRTLSNNWINCNYNQICEPFFMIARSIFYPSCLKFSKQSYLIHQPFQTAKHNIIMLLFFYPQLLINVLILWQIWHKYKTLCCCFQTITNDVSIYKWSCRCLNQNMLIYNINKKYLCSFLSFVPKLSIFYQME